MNRSPGSDLQRAVQFLSSPDFGKGAALPPRPDYEALARYASGLGFELSPEALKGAFRMIMRARLVASRRVATPGL